MAYFEVGLNIHLILFLLFNFSFQQLQDCPKNSPIKYQNGCSLILLRIRISKWKLCSGQ